jgi:hypothetical protein
MRGRVASIPSTRFIRRIHHHHRVRDESVLAAQDPAQPAVIS